MQWWEKTVEYAFVLEAANVGARFAAPLAGREDRAGDAIFEGGTRFEPTALVANASAQRLFLPANLSTFFFGGSPENALRGDACGSGK